MKDWYSVKGLFRWFFKANGRTDLVEERVVLFLANDFDDALDRAEQEAKTYCRTDRKANFRIEPIGWWHAYRLDEKPSSGVEVFSRRSSTPLSGNAFVKRYYPRSHVSKSAARP